MLLVKFQPLMDLAFGIVRSNKNLMDGVLVRDRDNVGRYGEQ